MIRSAVQGNSISEMLSFPTVNRFEIGAAYCNILNLISRYKSMNLLQNFTFSELTKFAFYQQIISKLSVGKWLIREKS